MLIYRRFGSFSVMPPNMRFDFPFCSTPVKLECGNRLCAKCRSLLGAFEMKHKNKAQRFTLCFVFCSY